MKEYTKTELEAIGLNDVQINAILSQQQTTKEAMKVINELEGSEAEGSKIINYTEAKHHVEETYSESDITSISDIKRYTAGTIVRLPDFADGAPFIAKVKRPSLMSLIKTGQIPNSLLSQATKLFQQGAQSLGKDNTIADMFGIIEKVCEAALVTPSYKEIKDEDLELTDEQMMAIFSYTQQGVAALEKFR